MKKRQNLQGWFRNQVIRNKIIFIYLPLIILPLSILGYLSNHIYSKAIVDKTVNSISDNSNLMITRINGIINNTESMANMITLNLNKILVEESDQLSISDLQRYTQITNQLSYALLVFQDVDSAAFIDINNRVYGSHMNVERNADLVFDTNIIQTLNKTRGSNTWFQMERRNYLVNNSDEPVLSLGKRIVNINTGNTMGYLILNVNETTLSEVYDEIGLIQETDYMIVNHGGTVVSAQNSEMVLKPIKDTVLINWMLEGKEKQINVEMINGSKTLLVSHDMSRFDWKLISMVPYELLVKDTRKIMLLIVLIGFICLVFAVAGAIFLSHIIAKPIVELARHMKRVKEGNLDRQFEVNGRDEVGLLASGFNTMIGRVKDLLLNISIEQKKKREYELALIQAQIKPHFLYNTLDVIYALSELGRTRDVQRTTKALADFYRSVLSKGKEQITLSEEMESVINYLSIQRIRYLDVFTYQIDIAADIDDCIIPKLTLQPLVENAIYHGLKHKEEIGSLLIKGWKEGNLVILQIIDNGIGMPEDRLKDIKRSWNDSNQPGYGLSNVHQRIKLYFGEQFGLQVESTVDIGTKVTLLIPYQTLEVR